MLKELELSENFPELKKRVDLERKRILANIELKDELKHSLYRMDPGKDLVIELIDQFKVHEELDKIRRDLNEFTYRAKDASYLFKEETSIVFKERLDDKRKLQSSIEIKDHRVAEVNFLLS